MTAPSTAASSTRNEGPLLVGIDIGGTFTDVVALRANGTVVASKVPSTPPDFERGFFDALAEIAAQLGESVDTLLSHTRHIAHGTTVATNVLVQRRGARVGLLATAGHGDALLLMRGEGRTAGLPPEELARVHHSDKPDPLVPRRLIREVVERVDAAGEIVVPLNVKQAAAQVQSLADAGIDALAISLLWSLRHPGHEQRLHDIARDILGDGAFITLSSDLAPRMGEYERTATTALNAYVGPQTSGYLRKLEQRLREMSYQGRLLVMQCTGGTGEVDALIERPLLTYQSGPVGGVTACAYLGEALGSANLIATDVGGTSFDVALVVDGSPETTSTTTFSQYSFYLPMVDVRSIGAGGGSIARVDAASGGLRVGPESAGAIPGPACYGRGGRDATVTDAALVLGYLDPGAFLGGRMPLDREAAATAIEPLANQLGISVEETAAGILRVVEFRMADLLRAMTVERGYDPRDFDVVVYGGAGPVHAGVYARELGARRAIVPLGAAASVWSALGCAAADLVSVAELVDPQIAPFNRSTVDANFRRLETEVSARLRHSGDAGGTQPVLQRFLDLRYKGQMHEIEIDVTSTDLDEILVAFENRYTQLYGPAATLWGAPVEAVTFRIRGRLASGRPPLSEILDTKLAAPEYRKIWWPEYRAWTETPVYVLDTTVHRLPLMTGPVVLDLPLTSVVVHPGQSVRSDELGNLILDLQVGVDEEIAQ